MTDTSSRPLGGAGSAEMVSLQQGGGPNSQTFGRRRMVGVRSRLSRRSNSDFEELQHDRLAFFRRCSQTADIVPFRAGPDDAMVVSHPSLVNDVLITHRSDFSKAYLTSLMHPLLAGSMLLSDSDSWLHERRLVLPAFHHERLQEYGAVMADEARRVSAGWKVAHRRDLHSDMMQMTLQIVTRTLFGIDFSNGVNAAQRLVSIIMDEFNRRIASPRRIPVALPTPRTLRLLRSMRELDVIAYTAIRERRRNPGSDLLSMLIAAKGEDGMPMSDREVRDASLAVFFAGHETTACLLSWTWYVLANRKDIQDKVLGELRRELPAGREASAALVNRLPYTEAVLNEVLRLYPPAYAFGRRALRDTRVGTHPVPAGTTVVMSPWSMHRDPRFYEDPEQFVPERWQNGLAARLPKFAFFPFSSGPRRCVGSAYAMQEATIAVATILPRYELSSSGEPVEPAPSITLRPEGGMPLTVTPRQ
jgi:cytochrome P450